MKNKFIKPICSGALATMFLIMQNSVFNVLADPNVVQTTGSSTTDVMSQKATTDMVFDPDNPDAVAIGTDSSAAKGSVALGNGSKAEESYVVSVGDGVDSHYGKRRIVNVRDPISSQDAATKNYVDNLIDGIPELPTVLQSTGKSETAVMSQSAVTNAIDAAQNTLASELNETQIPVVTTAGSNTDLIATVPDWEVKVGKMIVIIPHVTGTSNAITLNVNSDGAKTFTCTDSSGASGGFGSASPVLTAGTPVLIVRGATQWNVLNISKPNVNSVNGILPIANGGTGAATLSAAQTVLGIPSFPLSLANGGTEATTAADARTNLSVYSKAEIDSALTKQAIGNMMYPVGSIYISITSTNPSTLFGGTWSAWGQGRIPLGMGSNGTTNYTTVQATNASTTETHTLTSAQMPSHTHIQNAHRHDYGRPALFGGEDEDDGSFFTPRWSGRTSNQYQGNSFWRTEVTNTTATNQNTGGGGSHNNMQPYITCYMWHRTA